MMISKADFEELFPATFDPKRQRAKTRATHTAHAPGAAYIARREDDGRLFTPQDRSEASWADTVTREGPRTPG